MAEVYYDSHEDVWVCNGCGRVHVEDEFDPPSMQLEGFRVTHARCPPVTTWPPPPDASPGQGSTR